VLAALCQSGGAFAQGTGQPATAQERHELEAKTIVDHGEAPRGQGDALPINTGDVLALGGWPMNQTCLGREPCRYLVELPAPQGVEQVARENDTLTLAVCQTFLDEVIATPIHSFEHFAADGTCER
jgi:hypothetical protein